MNCENHLEKNPRAPQYSYAQLTASQLQKTTSEKANFCSNTVFSIYFKIRVKKFHAAKSRRRNKKKNQEKANNSPSYRCAAIKKKTSPILLFES